MLHFPLFNARTTESVRTREQHIGLAIHADDALVGRWISGSRTFSAGCRCGIGNRLDRVHQHRGSRATGVLTSNQCGDVRLKSPEDRQELFQVQQSILLDTPRLQSNFYARYPDGRLPEYRRVRALLQCEH